MRCDTAQNRLLALPDPDRPTDDLRAHLAGCERCRRYAERAAGLDADLAALPAPPSADARAAFLESLAAAGPVIRTVPTAPFRSSVSLWGLAARVRWKPVFATAAAVLVAVGVWSALPGPKPPPVERDGPRSELVKKVVRYNTELAKASDPRERVTKLAELAADLQAETRDVYLAAQTGETDQLRSLANMFEQVVGDGIVRQAKAIGPFGPVTERQKVLKETAARLAAAAAEADQLRTTAAQAHAKVSLAKMAAAARNGQAVLLKIAEGT